MESVDLGECEFIVKECLSAQEVGEMKKIIRRGWDLEQYVLKWEC